MVLDFEYGVNTGNRFLQFVDHDEEPDAFIAAQTREEEDKQKKSSTKDTKTTATKKVTSKTTTVTTTTAATKTNKENLQTKSTNVDQRRQQSATVPAVFGDSNNQQTRGDSARGSRGGSRRGGPPFEGAGRGRSQRFNKFEGQGSSSTNESSSFEQGGRGQGGPRRGNFEGGRGNFEGGRGGGRGRGGRGGRGGGFNRNQEEGAQQDNSGWQQTAESNFDNTRTQSNREYDQEVSPTERPFEPDNSRRARGNYRGGRSFHSNRSFADREGGGGEEDYRANRRQHDRQPRSFVTGVKPIEKKDGEGAHNWGNPTENPEDHQISDEITETTAQTAPASKDWAQQVDEAEKQMTLDEYKKQQEAKRRAQLEKVPQFKTRVAGEGEDPKSFQKYEQEYRKKNDGEDSDEEVDEEGSGVEEESAGEEEEQISGKKKVITIPLRFKPIEIPRGSAGSRGGPRRGGGSRFRGNNRDEQPRSTSPNQGQQSPSTQQYDDQQSSYRGGQRGGRGDYRRSARGTRQGRGNNDPNAPALDNPEDFPTLPKQ